MDQYLRTREPILKKFLSQSDGLHFFIDPHNDDEMFRNILLFLGPEKERLQVLLRHPPTKKSFYQFLPSIILDYLPPSIIPSIVPYIYDEYDDTDKGFEIIKSIFLNEMERLADTEVPNISLDVKMIDTQYRKIYKRIRRRISLERKELVSHEYTLPYKLLEALKHKHYPHQYEFEIYREQKNPLN